MQRFYELVAFLVGLNIGSFLNVVIARVPEGLSVVYPPSRCPRCKAGIRWFDNIPVVSWLLLRGKCRGCQLPISPRYPAVELLTGLLAYAIAREHAPGPWSSALFIFSCLLVAATYIDLDHWIIPHVLTWPGIVIGIAASHFAPDHTLLDGLWGALGGFGIFALIGLIGIVLFKKEALGQGDWWLLAMIGAFLGWKALLPVILLASLQGTVVGLLLIALGRNETGEAPEAENQASEESKPVDGEASADDDEEWVPPKNAVPFGPFLALGAFEQLFLGDWLAQLYGAILQRLFS